jgi:hypothetical protein
VSTETLPYALGTTGIPFGGGALQWVQHANGTWGWKDPTSGRTWDGNGNPYQTTTAASTGQQPTQQTTTGYVAPAVTSSATTQANTLQQNIDRGQQILAGLPDPQHVNVASYLKLPKSVQQTVLAGYEAKGFDPNDVAEQFGRMLPQKSGPRTGYVAPLGAN